MPISARNRLKGKIKSIKEGAVMTEVTVEVAGGTEVVAVITKSSADGMQLRVGQDAYAVIKSTDVMVMTD